MAGNLAKAGPELTREGLAHLTRLTRNLARAVAQGDLDGAMALLEQRRGALEGVVWPEKADPEFWEQVRSLRGLEEEVTAFCRTWREVVAKRLQSLQNAHLLRLSYNRTEENSRFIDVNK